MPRSSLLPGEFDRARCCQSTYFEIDEDLYEGDRFICLDTIVRESSEISLKVGDLLVLTHPGKTEDGMCYGSFLGISFDAYFKLEAGKPWMRMNLAQLIAFIIEGDGGLFHGPLREDGRL